MFIFHANTLLIFFYLVMWIFLFFFFSGQSLGFVLEHYIYIYLGQVMQYTFDPVIANSEEWLDEVVRNIIHSCFTYLIEES